MPANFNRLAVKYFKEFEIPLAGLGLGLHNYSFEIGAKFFSHLEYAAFEDGDVKVNLLLDKRENLIEFKFELDGYVVVECARCLDPLNQSVHGTNHLIIKYGEHYLEESDEVLILPHDQHYFDLSHLIYEYISLLVPFKCTHPVDENGKSECNALMIKKLSEHRHEHHPDQRWDALKHLQKKMK